MAAQPQPQQKARLPVSLKEKILPITRDTESLVTPLLGILRADERYADPAATAVMQTSESTSSYGGYQSRTFLDLGSDKDARRSVESKRLVRRDCYDHLMPLILHEMQADHGRVALSGTPGIGKTIFGFFLLRELMRNKSHGCHTVVYWDKTHATMFSIDENNTKDYGLNQNTEIDGEPWSYGTWKPDESALIGEVLWPDDIWVIHDPAMGFIAGGMAPNAELVLIIVSFGHDLVGAWSTKGFRPECSITMPCASEGEIMANKANFFFEKTGMAWDDARVQEKYSRFGGSIRHWGDKNEEDAWFELVAKVGEVVRSRGANIIARTTKHRGSVVHVDVDFDITKPLYPAEGHNSFDGKYFRLGSTALTHQFAAELNNLGSNEFKAFMASVRSEKGGQALYGLLFEIHAHNFLRHKKKSLNFRVVRRDGKNKYQYATIQVPVGDEVLSFQGARAGGISAAAGEEKIAVGTYILPELDSFPTYDAAVAIPGEVVGFTEKKLVGLLLQMTVSGATSIHRKPEHVVRQYMRTEMHAALKAAVEGFSESSISVTTFCVPSACFHPFLFQMETRKDTDQEMVQQPEFQFVIEIPEFMSLPQSKVTVGEVHSASGRAHKYMLRDGNPKRVKTQHIRDMDD